MARKAKPRIKMETIKENDQALIPVLWNNKPILTQDRFFLYFPEFANFNEDENQSIIESAIFHGSNAIDPDAWGDGMDYGAALASAHFLALGLNAKGSADANSIPGLDFGVITNKSVGPISKAISQNLNPANGQWDYTIYGQRYRELARATALGGKQF